MKNSKSIKIVLSVLILLIIGLVSGNVFAADDNLVHDLTGTLNNVGNNTTTNNTTGNNTTTLNTATNNTTLTTNNTSTYNNTTLPKTGIEDSMPAILLVVIFGISAVYAYRKIQDYKNI